MITRLLKTGRIIAFSPFISSDENPHDTIDKEKLNPKYPNDTGFQRLRNLFRPSYDDVLHPKVATVIHTSVATFLMGAVYGAVTSSRTAFINFIENNEATRFRSHLDAKRQLSDAMFTSFIKGGVKWGLKVSLFCTTFVVSYTVISVYRNKESPLYYTFAGMTTGTLYKFSLGPKGMIAGGFFGGVFGTIYGCSKYLIMQLTQLTEEALSETIKESQIAREDAIKDAFKYRQHKDAEEELLEIMSESTPS